MRGPPPTLAVAVAVLLALLAGCVGEQAAEASDDEARTGGDGARSGVGSGASTRLGPDDGWLAFDAEATTSERTFEGSFQPHEAWSPVHPALLAAGAGGQVPPTNEQHDLSADIPADVPVRISIELSIESSAGGVWLNGPNRAFWLYDGQGTADGMTVQALVVRQADEAIMLGVWYGGPEPAAEVAYSATVRIDIAPDRFPATVAYGIDVRADEFLEIRFDAPPGPESVWVWDGADRFLGAFTPDRDDGKSLVIVADDPELGATAGEFVVFVIENQPDFRMRVIAPESTRDAPVRVLEQAIMNQGPYTATGGQESVHTYDVPVAPFQVGYSFAVPQVVVDPAIALEDPSGETVHEIQLDGPAGPAVAGFHNTDMGVPRMPSGTYTLRYSNAQGTDATLDAWYVTYGR